MEDGETSGTVNKNVWFFTVTGSLCQYCGNSQKKKQPVEYSVLAVLLNVRRMRKECSWRNGCQSNVGSLNKHWVLGKG